MSSECRCSVLQPRRTVSIKRRTNFFFLLFFFIDHKSDLADETATIIANTTAAAATTIISTIASNATEAPATSSPLTVNAGDAAYLLACTALVLLMVAPGLGLFYGGLLKSKSLTSMLAQSFAIMAMVGVMWALWGYSLAFSIDNPYIGGVSKCLMIGITPASVVATFTPGEAVPELAFFAFQMTFAMITPAIIIGGPAERITFPAVMLFCALWSTIVYAPIAHWTWVIPDPNLMVAAGWARENAGNSTAALAEANVLLEHALGEAGWLARLGALDFAGGGVVHINSGFAALVASIIVGRRVPANDVEKPHSLTLSMVGTALLFVGWLGFNGGSALQGNAYAALAVSNTMISACSGAISWTAIIGFMNRKASLLALLAGAVTGLVVITPAAGLASPMGALIVGLLGSPVCVFFTFYVKPKLGYDDTLDAFGVHGVGGVFGALATAFLVSPALGGVGIVDYTNVKGGYVGTYDAGFQFGVQLAAVVCVALYTTVMSALLLLFVDKTIGLRRQPIEESDGLDFVDHGESAYSYGPDAFQFVEAGEHKINAGPRDLTWNDKTLAPPPKKFSFRQLEELNDVAVTTSKRYASKHNFYDSKGPAARADADAKPDAAAKPTAAESKPAAEPDNEPSSKDGSASAEEPDDKQADDVRLKVKRKKAKEGKKKASK